MRVAYYEVFRDKEGQHRWRLVADNHEIVAASEPYPTRAHALRGASDAAKVSRDADVEVRDEAEE